MTMNVNLSPQLEAMVKAKVASGLYTSASEVVREALRLMEPQDQLRSLKIQQLRHDIQEGRKRKASRRTAPRPLEGSRSGKRSHLHADDRMFNRSLFRSVQAIAANELKTYGDLRYVMMPAEEYQRLRDSELEMALLEARAELAAGRCIEESVDEHLVRIDVLAAELA